MSGTRSANVPTKDEFDALAAKVDKNTADIASLNTRVTKLEQGQPQPPQKVPSPDGTTVTSTTGSIIDSRLRTFKLVGTAANYQIDCDGAVTGGSVVKLYAKGGVCYQSNAYGGWWMASKDGAVDSADDWVSTTDPTGSTPPPVVGTAPPKQAADAGFNTCVMNTDFVSQDECTDFDSGKAAFWFTGSCNGGRLINWNQMKIENSILSILYSGSFATSLTTTHDNSAVKSTPQNKVTTPNTHGIIYTYGYFEAKMRCKNTSGGHTNNWWPAWWATASHFQSGDQLELDFMEIHPGPTNGFWNWFASDGSGQGPYGQAFVAGGADGYPGYDFSDNCAAAGLDMAGGWNIYGCLWTTTRLTFYWTSAARRQAGQPDTVVGTYPTTTPIKGQTNAGVQGNYTLKGANNGNGLMLMIAGSQNEDVQFDFVRAWQ